MQAIHFAKEGKEEKGGEGRGGNFWRTALVICGQYLV